MPEPSLTGPLLLGLATRLGPLLAAPAPLLGVRLGDLAEELGARTGPVLRTLNQAVTQLVAAGHCTLDAFPGSDPLADAGTRVLLTPAGLAAARTREARIGQPGPTQVSSLAMDLGAEFQEGRLVAPRLHSTPADLGRHAAAEPWVLPVLLLLWLEPRWYLNVLATLLQFLARMDRVDLGSAARTLGTAKGLGDRCTTLVPFLPALYLGKDRGQRTLGLVAPLPPITFAADGAPLPADAVRAVLAQAFGLKGIDPLARLQRNSRAGREAMGSEEGEGDEAPPEADDPPEA